MTDHSQSAKTHTGPQDEPQPQPGEGDAANYHSRDPVVLSPDLRQDHILHRTKRNEATTLQQQTISKAPKTPLLFIILLHFPFFPP